MTCFRPFLLLLLLLLLHRPPSEQISANAAKREFPTLETRELQFKQKRKITAYSKETGANV